MIHAPASLHAAMIRRRERLVEASGAKAEAIRAERSRLAEDLRFFLLAWAIGFVAFLVFIA